MIAMVFAVMLQASYLDTYKKGDYKKSINEALKVYEKTKNPEPMIFAANVSKEIGDINNYKKYLELASSGNSIDAKFKLLLEDFKENKDPEKLKSYCNNFEKYAKLGISDAAYMTGMCYYTGKGFKKNEKMALFWFRRSDNIKDNIPAEYMLGYILYKNGDKQWKDFLTSSALKGDKDSIVLLANILIQESDKNNFSPETVYWTKKALVESGDKNLWMMWDKYEMQRFEK